MANSPRVRDSGALFASSDLFNKSVLFTAKIEPLKATILSFKKLI